MENKDQLQKKYALSLYFIILTFILPLAITPNGYTNIDSVKYNVFRLATLFFILVALLWWGIPSLGINLKSTIKEIKSSSTNIFSAFTNCSIITNSSVILKCAALFFLCSLITFLTAPSTRDAFWGAPGWYMGFFTFILLIGILIAFTTMWNDKLIFLFYIAAFAGLIVYLIAILNRFLIDPLGVYTNISAEYYITFLSTIGQSTWFSSYMCVSYPIGLAFIYFDSNNKRRYLAMLYCVIASISLVTQNSDSAYISLAAVMLTLFYISLENPGRMARYFEIIILISASFAFTGILQRLAGEHYLLLDSLSIELSQGLISWVVLFICIFIRILIDKYAKESWLHSESIKKLRRLFIIVLSLSFLLLITLIILNSLGFIQRICGFTLENNYLLFNEAWGNTRGQIWAFSCKLYKEMPLGYKLFGTGQDCYYTYAYDIAGYADYLNSIYGINKVLDCAHNELLNLLICNGLVGLLSFLSLILSTIRQGFIQMNKYQNPEKNNNADDPIKSDIENKNSQIILLGATLCIISYMSHNFFCYSQVMCTPYLFMYIGIIARHKS